MKNKVTIETSLNRLQDKIYVVFELDRMLVAATSLEKQLADTWGEHLTAEQEKKQRQLAIYAENSRKRREKKEEERKRKAEAAKYGLTICEEGGQLSLADDSVGRLSLVNSEG